MKRVLGGLRGSIQSALAVAADSLPVFIIEFGFGPFLFALHLFLRCKSSFLTAAQLAVRYQALEQKLGRGDNVGRSVRTLYTHCRQLFEKPLNLFEVRESRRGGLIVVKFHRPAEVEP